MFLRSNKGNNINIVLVIKSNCLIQTVAHNVLCISVYTAHGVDY